MKKWIVLIISISWLPILRAIVPIHTYPEPTIPFYRSPQSLFASGTMPLSALKKSLRQTQQEIWYYAESEEQKKWIPKSKLFFFPSTANTSKQQLGIVTEKTSVLRLSQGWRQSGSLNAGSQVNITTVRSDWSCGEDRSGPICIPSNKLILSIDEADRVRDKKGQWYKIKKRKLHQVITAENKLLPLANITDWEKHDSIAFVKEANETLLTLSETPNHSNLSNLANQWPPFTKITLLKKETRRWNQSWLAGHGNVWWSDNSHSSEQDSPFIITREEMSNRPLFFMTTSSSSEKKTKLSLASANGIFYSSDGGDTWTYLKQFGEANYPVAFGPRNSLIVGDQISFNQGKFFQNYLRWDQITQHAQKQLRQAPAQLSLHSIKSLDSSNIEVSIHTGYKLLSFELNMINNQLRLLHSKIN